MCGVRVGIQQHAEQLAARHPVDGGVVDLGHDRDSPPGQALDEIELPQWTPAVQRARVQARHLLGELAVVTRGGQCQLTDVKLEIEDRIVEPIGVVEVQRHRRQSPPKRRQ